MTNILQEFWCDPKNIFKNKIRKPIVCRDGFTMSVQASDTHYCCPRANLEDGNYSAWEVGFPNKKDKKLLPFIEVEGGDPKKNVYPFVPTEIILDVIKKHHGLAA